MLMTVFSRGIVKSLDISGSSSAKKNENKPSMRIITAALMLKCEHLFPMISLLPYFNKHTVSW